MKNELDSKRIRNIYIMLIAILLMTVISTAAILSYIFVHWDDRMNTNNNSSANYDVSEFTEIDYNGFMEKYKEDDKSLIYIGRSTCIHCVNFLPILKKAQKEYGYETYYLDISKINNEEVEGIRKLDKFLEENFGMTPMIIVVKNNSIIDNGTHLGEASYDDYSNFLENIGYEKD